MARTKRKDRISPKVLESDEKDEGSLFTQRGKEREHDTSQGRRIGTSNREGFDIEDTQMQHPHLGPPRPPPRGYRPNPRDMRHVSDWKGRYNPGIH
jgi:hypothetical protein